MIPLGFVQAKGASELCGAKAHPAVCLYLDAWREEQHTFVVDRWTTIARTVPEEEKKKEFPGCHGQWEGCVCGMVMWCGRSSFGREEGWGFLSHRRASAHVDDCCCVVRRTFSRMSAGMSLAGCL
jgi:hypothetical protein